MHRTLIRHHHHELLRGDGVANGDPLGRVVLIPMLDGVGHRLFQRQFHGEQRILAVAARFGLFEDDGLGVPRRHQRAGDLDDLEGRFVVGVHSNHIERMSV